MTVGRELTRLRSVGCRALVRAAKAVAGDEDWERQMMYRGALGMSGSWRLLAERGIRLHRIVDVGANVGQWTRLMRDVYPTASVFMVEAQSKHTETLKTLAATDPQHLSFAPNLVGPPGVESADFVVLDDEVGSGSSVLPENSDVARHVERMPMCTLDSLLSEHGIAAPDLLKLDVQGYELEVLKGAEGALVGCEFVLLEVSLWPYNRGGPLAAEVFGWMADRNFRAYEILAFARRPDGVMVQADVLFVSTRSHLLADEMTRYSPASR